MTESSPLTRTLLGLSHLPGMDAVTLRALSGAAAHGCADLRAWAAGHPKLSRVFAVAGAWARASEAAERQLAAAARIGARILSPADAAYPRLLIAARDPPPLLWVRGAWAPNPGASVAIVGTRQPTLDGTSIAARLTAHVVAHGSSIVSGLALGCDALAHRTALRAHGHTVAVLAHGLHTVYPPQHRALADAILDQGGALVSEFPFGCDPRRAQFVQRDRTQAGLAHGVVLIQSDLTGGSLHAARAALRFGRWVAVPYPTARDRWAAASHIRANRLAAEGSPSEKRQLFRCTAAALARLVVVRGREDLGPLMRDLTPAGDVEKSGPYTRDLWANRFG